MKKIKYLLIVFIIVILLISSVVIITYSKYISKNPATVTAEIANPIIVIEGDDTILKENVSEYNLAADYNFVVKNYKDEKINEVVLKYNIIIESDNDEIETIYKLYDITSEETEIFLDSENRSEDLEIGINEKEEKIYKLSVIASTGTNLNNKDLNIKIKIDVIQEEE